MITIQELIIKIRQSTLKKESQDALIDILPILQDWQIEEIEKTLDIDIQKQESIFAQATLKAKMIRKEFKDNLEKEVKKLQKKWRQDKLWKLWYNIDKWKMS